MLESLSEKLERIFKRLRSRGALTETEVAQALREVRLAMLEADVHYKVVKDFIDRLKAKAVGQEVMQSLTPGQQVMKIVRDELCSLLGETSTPLRMSSQPPTVIMLVGLQGVGKTTTAAKLGRVFQSKGRRVLLVAADPKRPAASEQLGTLGAQLEIEVRHGDGIKDPGKVCQQAVEHARLAGHEVVILDTAGRLHVDAVLMRELAQIKAAVGPNEILLVADGMTGQVAVSVAEAFHGQLGLTGMILTKMEGDARGGALLSIRQVTGQPIKYLGTGEGLSALEPFHPDRVASRILGMGDVLSLIDRVQAQIPAEEFAPPPKAFGGEGFSLVEFRDQMRQMRKLGSISEVLGMIPGLLKFRQSLSSDPQGPEREMKRISAVIDSMTLRERQHPQILNGSRKLRISRGSGVGVQEINRFLKQFQKMKKMMKAMGTRHGQQALQNLFLGR